MSKLKAASRLPVEVSAVLCRLRIPVSTLAALKTEDCLEIVEPCRWPPRIELWANGRPFAEATLIQEGGAAFAEINRILEGTPPKVYARWQIAKRPTDTA